MTKQPTIADVAREAGLSRATISLVIADSPQIPEPTKQRVRATMERMGYVYNRLAGMVRGGRSHIIGLIVTNIRNPYFAELSMSVDAATRAAGYTLLQGYSFGDATRERSLIRAMRETQADGLIVLAAADADTDAFDGPTSNGPAAVVALLREPPAGAVADFVGVAESESGMLLGAHLADQGIRSAAFIGGMAESRIREARLRGLRKGFGAPDALPAPLTLPATQRDYDINEAGRLIDRLVAIGPLPDAVIAYNDSWAGGIYPALRKYGIEPGRDVAVASFDNIPAAQQMYPPLTSVDTDPWQVGAAAVRLIVERVEHPQRAAESLLIEPHLVERDSTLLAQVGSASRMAHDESHAGHLDERRIP